MNTAKKSSGGGPPSNKTLLDYTHEYWKNHYQNIQATK